MREFDFANMLREVGLRATPGRIKLLTLLAHEKKPLAVHTILKKFHGDMNEVTLYRALESLAEVGIVRRVDLGHEHAHYELTVGVAHHHHLVCTNCGRIEDFASSLCESAIRNVARAARSFKTVTAHSVELFGLCKKCA